MLSCIGVAHSAESFKSSEFLKYSAWSQQGYITTAAGMAGVIATQNNRSQATCIDNWLAKHRTNGFQPIISAMTKNPEYHPMGIIAGILQKACGSFKYTR